MARKRMLHPEFFTDRKISALPLDVQRTFQGCWVYCDDYGRGELDPALVKAAVWPQYDKVSIRKVAQMLAQLADECLICEYVIDGKELFHVVNFGKYQAVQHKGKFPSPPCPFHESEGFPPPESLASLSRRSRDAFTRNVVEVSEEEISSGDLDANVVAQFPVFGRRGRAGEAS